MDVEVAERNLCEDFALTYPEDTATQALYTMMDTSGQVSPSLKAMASSWLRLNPDLATAARDIYHQECAEQFASYFNEKAAETAFKVQHFERYDICTSYLHGCIYFLSDFEWLGKRTGDAVVRARRSLASIQYGYVLCYGRAAAHCDGTGVPRKQVMTFVLRWMDCFNYYEI